MKQEDYQLDIIDKNIIQMLMDSGKTPLALIADKVGISTTGVHQRVKKMEQAGVIETSVALLNPRRIGYKVSAFVGVYISQPDKTQSIINLLREIEEVVEVHYVTGSYTLLLKLVCIDNDHLMDVLNSVQVLEGVRRTETLISLGQEINRQLKVVSEKWK
ncbi:MAG: Lrp/AsnC ligand binding domain-containing protein [Flavobacteriaceae bacterium]|nr:Lrp/AsnC ligand binding domain-containing protein [Flavobacteriaceae bacterium]